jgi:hypothetical protein
MKIKLFIVVSILLCYGHEVWSTTSDYWIIENPSALIIYNNYEQKLTEIEKNLIPEFSAWQIIETDHILGDQFTNTIKTVYNRKTYFFQVTSEGKLVNRTLAGQINKIRKASAQGDTVLVIASDRLSIQRGDKRISLLEGMLIQRIFSHRNKTFVREIAGNISGWIEGKGSVFWEAYVPESSNLAFEKQIFSRIDHIFRSYNTRLDKLFTHLNRLYNKSRTSPQWRPEESPSYLKYEIRPQDYKTQFSGSQSYLVQELTDLLYGSPYQLSAINGQIIISKSSR